MLSLSSLVVTLFFWISDINFLHDEMPTSQSIPTQEEEHFSEHGSNPLVILGDGDLVSSTFKVPM
jgi:hypothetical protein